ncbi:MAG TPA: hypothetical protein VFY65_14085 [Longimicrobium sp.]|nr:hypothetical protein [Longimicrobium sp.]
MNAIFTIAAHGPAGRIRPVHAARQTEIRGPNAAAPQPRRPAEPRAS